MGICSGLLLACQPSVSAPVPSPSTRPTVQPSSLSNPEPTTTPSPEPTAFVPLQVKVEHLIRNSRFPSIRCYNPNTGYAYLSDSEELFKMKLAQNLGQQTEPVYVIGQNFSSRYDGNKEQASFLGIGRCAVNKRGDIHIADWGALRLLDPSESLLVTLFSDRSTPKDIIDGPLDVVEVRGVDSPVFSSDGKLYFSDYHLLRVMENGQVKTLNTGDIERTPSDKEIEKSTDGPVAQATFSTSILLTIDPQDNLYILDTGMQQLRKMTSEQIVTTLPVKNTEKYGPLWAAFGFAYLPSKNIFVILKREKIYSLDQLGNLTVLVENAEQNKDEEPVIMYASNLLVTPDETIYFTDQYGLKRFRLD